MTAPWLSRTEQLLGEEKIALLQKASVLVVGTGGVGAYAAEMLVRAGVGTIVLVDGDVVSESNINRQLIALHSTVGLSKATLLKERLLDINPQLNIAAHHLFLDEVSIPPLLMGERFHFVIDAIDTIAPKVTLIETCLHNKIKIISSMGAGGRIDPTLLRYADISNTYHCTLAKVVRQRLKAKGITRGVPVVFSAEQPDRKAVIITENERNKRSTVGTLSYLPVLFGCHLAAYVIKKLTQL